MTFMAVSAMSQGKSDEQAKMSFADLYKGVFPAKGYADTLTMRHWNNGTTPDSLKGYRLTLTDAQTIRFRCLGFQYTRGLGTGMPDGKLPLDIRLYDDTSSPDSLKASFRWYVEGKENVCADTTALDTSGIVLSPGTYFLVYGGYLEDAMRYPLDLTATVIQDEQSAITVVMESLPLLPSPGKGEVTGWNTITAFTSRDGSLYNGESVMTQYDDFGRLAKSIARGMSPTGNDIVEVQDYDGFGRERRAWLPVASSSDTSLDKLLGDANGLDHGGCHADSEPYSFTVYEDSPLSRPMATYGPGEDWHAKGKGVVTASLANVSGNDTLGCVMLKAVNGGDNVIVRPDGEYASGTLAVTRTEDEDGGVRLTFKDRDERMVLDRRVLDEDGMRKLLDTYYVYEPFGNLVAVLPPAASDGIGTGNVDKELMDAYAYQYRYDDHDRMTGKKLPGCGWIHYAYDGNDRMVFIQDPVQRKQGRSTFVLCDSLGRQCVTGTCSFTFPQGHNVQGEVYCHYTGREEGLAGYAPSGITLTDARVATVTYYDNYDFLDDMCRDSKLPNGNLRYGQQAECATGLVTGRVNSVLESADSVTPRKLFSVIKYDHRARPARMETENLLGGYDVEDMGYDFLGRVTKRHLSHHVPRSGKDLAEEYTYAYDHAGRLLTVEHVVNGGQARVLADNLYDELGRLKANKANGSEALFTSYDYNLRSWLTKVTNPAFEEELLYNESDGTAKPLYGGNISSTEWKAGIDGGSRRYGFTYDGLGRLTAATYGEKATSGKKPGNGGGNYDTRYAYDKMGNILSLRRQGLHDDGVCDVIDDLKYTYDGNQVIRVGDSAIAPVYKDCFTFVDGTEDETEYEYDGNGNLTKDLNRGICGIRYNCLKLPSGVDFTDGSRITYTYDGGGRKLRTDYYMNPLTMSVPQLSGGAGTAGEDALVHTWTDYCANKVYENDTLRMSLFDVGYVSYDAKVAASSPSPSYHYYIKDHLGNNRVVLGENGAIEQVNHYYPFGGLMGESKSLASSQRYKYNGKELDRTHGLDWYDYGARMYDPALARWMAPDPLAEKYYGVSPYAYCHDNPMNAIDPDGRDDFFDENGKFIKKTKTGDNIMVKSGNNKYVNFTSVDFGKRHGALIGIGSYYLSQVDHDFNLNVERTGGDNPLSAGLANIGGTGKYLILIDQEGKVNPEYGVASNFINSFYHETRHRYDNSTLVKNIGEVNAVLLQTQHPSWDKVTTSFAHSQASYAASQLNIEFRYKPNSKVMHEYVNKLNEAFMSISTFSIENNLITVSNYIDEVIVNGTRKK